MDQKKIDYFKNRLKNERMSIVQTLSKMNENEPNSSLKEYFGELSSYDNHPADLGTETFMMEQNMNLKNNEELTLKLIDLALGKIENGTYGKCEICGNDIKQERLDIIPYVKTCNECRDDKISNHDLNNYRSVEEDSLKYPFGRTFKDKSNYTGVDGEDIYQHVAVFNKVENDLSLKTGDEEGVFDENESGIVEDIDKITNEYYKEQYSEE